MKKIILFMLALSIIPVIIFAQEDEGMIAVNKQQSVKLQWYIQQQKDEQSAFLETLENKEPKDRGALLLSHREAQYQDFRKFMIQLQQERLAIVKNRLAKNGKLTDTQQADALKQLNMSFQENLLLIKEQQGKAMLFIRETMNNPNMTAGQKIAAIKAYRAEQTSRVQEEIAKKKAERGKY